MKHEKTLVKLKDRQNTAECNRFFFWCSSVPNVFMIPIPRVTAHLGPSILDQRAHDCWPSLEEQRSEIQARSGGRHSLQRGTTQKLQESIHLRRLPSAPCRIHAASMSADLNIWQIQPATPGQDKGDKYFSMLVATVFGWENAWYNSATMIIPHRMSRNVQNVWLHWHQPFQKVPVRVSLHFAHPMGCSWETALTLPKHSLCKRNLESKLLYRRSRKMKWLKQ